MKILKIILAILTATVIAADQMSALWQTVFPFSEKGLHTMQINDLNISADPVELFYAESHLEPDSEETDRGESGKSTDTESTDTEFPDTESTDTESTDTESTDTESTATEPTDTEFTDTELTDTESTDTESTDSKSTDSEEQIEKKPDRTVSVEIPSGWENDIAGWSVTTSDEAKIYFYTSLYDNILDEKPEDACEWNGNDSLKDIPEGEGFVRFWAVFDIDGNDVAVSDVKSYRLDMTPPEEFVIDGKKELRVSVLSPSTYWVYNVYSASEIKDQFSTIEKLYISVSSSQCVEIPEESIKRSGSVLKFSYDIVESNERAIITVTAVDSAGNERSSSIDNISYDLYYPSIKKMRVVTPTNETNNNEWQENKFIIRESVSSDTDGSQFEYHVNDNYYLELTVQDNKYDDETIYIEAEKQIEKCLNSDSDTRFDSDTNTEDGNIQYMVEYSKIIEDGFFQEGKYYIPLGKAGINLKSGNQYIIKASVNDGENQSEQVTMGSIVAFDNSKVAIVPTTVKGDSMKQLGVKDAEKIGNYDAIYTVDCENGVKLSIHDNNGLADFRVTVNDKTVIETDVSKGRRVEDSDTAMDTDTSSDIDTDLEMTKTYHNEIITNENIDINFFKYLGNYAGRIHIHAEARNLAHESTSVDYYYVIDSGAPFIEKNSDGKDFRYNLEDKSPLRYFSFGIFGKSNLNLEINVTDCSGIGIKPEGVKLCIIDRDMQTKLASYSGEYVDSDKDSNLEHAGTYQFTLYSNNVPDGIPCIELSDYLGHTSTYFFKSEEGMLTDIKDMSIIESSIVLETSKPHIYIGPDTDNGTTIIEDGLMYFGDDTECTVNFHFKDKAGIDSYSITISPDGEQEYGIENESVIYVSNDRVSKTEPNMDTEEKINLSNLETGVYKITVKAVDVSGNESSDIEAAPELQLSKGSVQKIIIDREAPEIVDMAYTHTVSALRYFTFGIFGKDMVEIDFEVKDNLQGIGVDEVKLFFSTPDAEDEYITPDKVNGDHYIFTIDSPKEETTPYIVVKDKLGNKNVYYLATVSEGIKESPEGTTESLYIDNSTDSRDKKGATLLLEKTPPEVELFISDMYKSYEVDGEMWYPYDISYTVTAMDTLSGLNAVFVDENGITTVESDINGRSLANNRFLDTAQYTYKAEKSDNYTIVVTAKDNAGNVNDPKEYKFSIDKDNPNITRFMFGDDIDEGGEVERGTYGFFFMVDTEVKVYVNDPGNSSKIKTVSLILKNVGENTGNTVAKTTVTSVSSNDLKEDANGIYASFTIPQGFKGQVAAEVVDNVEHTSGLVNADGNIIEDADLHSRTSEISILENISTSNRDIHGVPLYNESIPLTVTITDSFSGIASIDWSIKNDKKRGSIIVDEDGKVISDSVKITDTKSESNLVTMITFEITVEDNSNSNDVDIKLTDHSGNTSEYSKKYSIDKTAPIITTSFENTSAHNGNYYNTAQTVNITIRERNFSGSDVQVVVNGSPVDVSWDNPGLSVGEDSTEHHASLTLANDGVYLYSIYYTDLAGNEGNSNSSDSFTIDTIKPTTNISFDLGDDSIDNQYFRGERNITFTVNDQNFCTAVVKITKDGKDVSDNYSLDNWEQNYLLSNIYTMSVSIKDNGYYRVYISVTDKAGNSYEKVSKSFYIDKDSPKVVINIDNVKNGAPSNEEVIVPVISVVDEDGNLDIDSVTIKIVTVKLGENLEIVSDTKIIKGLSEFKISGIGTVSEEIDSNSDKLTFVLNNLEDDGIYTFEVTASDLAGNVGGASEEEKEKGSEYKISVNRLGSTYEVDTCITSVAPALRYYRNNEDCPFSFTIKEYNVNKLNPKDTIVKVTCDGTVVENSVVGVESDSAEEWGVYTYEFPSDLLKESGKYIVKLYSIDAAGNENPLEINGDAERATVTFFIDNIVPEVYFRDAEDKTEFTNENPYRTDIKKVEVEVYDNSQQEIQNISFTLNGKPIEVSHEPDTMLYTFDIPSKTSTQNVSVSLSDIAGNNIDVGVEDFLITTNLLILWISNTPLFVSSIIVVVLAVVGVVFVLMRKKRRV